MKKRKDESLSKWGIKTALRPSRNAETVYLCKCGGEVRKAKRNPFWWHCKDCKKQFHEDVVEKYCEKIQEE